MPITANLVTTEDLDNLKAELTAEFIRLQRTQLLELFRLVQKVVTDCQANLANDPDLGAQASQTQQNVAAAGQQVQATAAGVTNGTATQADVDALKETVKGVTEQVTELKAELERRVSALEADVEALKTANDANDAWKTNIDTAYTVMSDVVDSTRIANAALTATVTGHEQWKVTVDGALSNQALTLANHSTALTDHTSAIKSLATAINGTVAAPGQTAVIGICERTLQNETDIEEIRKELTKNKFKVWIFLAVIVTAALIGAAVGAIFWSAWVLGLMIGTTLGGIGGFIAAISNVKMSKSRRNPAQPSNPPAPTAPVPVPPASPAPAPVPQP